MGFLLKLDSICVRSVRLWTILLASFAFTFLSYVLYHASFISCSRRTTTIQALWMGEPHDPLQSSNPIFTYNITFAKRGPIQVRLLINPQKVINRCKELANPLQNFSVVSLQSLVFVGSSPEQGELRQLIRNTWKQGSNEAEVVFLIGRNRATSEIPDEILVESEAHGDIILTDITEHFYFIPLKSYSMIYWTESFCPHVPCSMKTDTDSIVFLNNLVNFCKRVYIDNDANIRAGKIYGACWKGAKPDRSRKNMKTYIPFEVYSKKVFPTYCSGSGYVLTKESRPKLLDKVPTHPWKPSWLRNLPEDIFITGVLAEAAKVPRIHKWDFHYERKLTFDPCETKTVLTTHLLKKNELLLNAWENFQNATTQICKPKPKLKPKPKPKKKRQ